MQKYRRLLLSFIAVLTTAIVACGINLLSGKDEVQNEVVNEPQISSIISTDEMINNNPTSMVESSTYGSLLLKWTCGTGVYKIQIMYANNLYGNADYYAGTIYEGETYSGYFTTFSDGFNESVYVVIYVEYNTGYGYDYWEKVDGAYPSNTNSSTNFTNGKTYDRYIHLKLHAKQTKTTGTVSASISGTAQYGSTLSVSASTNSNGSKSYQWWYSTSSTATSGTNISGATSSSYTINNSNCVGKYVGCKVSVAGTSSYTACSCSAKTSSTIAKAAGYISTTPTAKSLTYNGSAQALVNAGSGASGTIYYKAANSNQTSYGTGIPTATNAGTYYVYYYAEASTGYYATSESYVTVTISKAAGYVSNAPTAKTLTYNGSAQELVNAGSGTGTMYYWVASNQNWVTPIPTETNAGSYSVFYKVGESTNYTESNWTYVTVSIAKASAGISNLSISGTVQYNQTLSMNATVASNGTKTYQWWYADSGSATSGTNISGATSSTCTIGTGLIGKYIGCTLSVAEATNYNSGSGYAITASTVVKASGNINYNNTEINKTYGNSAFTNTLTHAGDGSVSYTSSNTSVATITNSGQVTIVGAGSTTITATVTEGSNYTYATNIKTYTLSVEKADSAIVCDTSQMNLTYGGSNGTRAVSTTSGGTISVSSGNTSVATVSISSGNITVVPISVGQATITVSATADGNHNTPSNVSFTVSVAKATPSILVTITGRPNYNSTLTANVSTVSNGTKSYQWWYADSSSATSGTSISGATNATFTVTSSLNSKYIGCTVNVTSTESYNAISGFAITSDYCAERVAGLYVTGTTSYVKITIASEEVDATWANLQTGDFIQVNNGVLTSDTNTTTLNGELVIASDITTVAENAFKNCAHLTSIQFMGNPTTIGNSAFENDTNLTIIYLPNTLTSFGTNVFKNANGMIYFNGSSAEWTALSTEYTANTSSSTGGNCEIFVNCLNSVAFNDNDSELTLTMPTDSNLYYVGNQITLPSTTGIEKEGFTLLGWNTNAYAKTALTSTNGKYVIQENDVVDGAITFYAVWLDNSLPLEPPDAGIYYDSSIAYMLATALIILSGIYIGIELTAKNRKN